MSIFFGSGGSWVAFTANGYGAGVGFVLIGELFGYELSLCYRESQLIGLDDRLLRKNVSF